VLILAQLGQIEEARALERQLPPAGPSVAEGMAALVALAGIAGGPPGGDGSSAWAWIHRVARTDATVRLVLGQLGHALRA
jgi:hypothetical protein